MGRVVGCLERRRAVNTMVSTKPQLPPEHANSFLGAKDPMPD
jgi:hypothetical protein